MGRRGSELVNNQFCRFRRHTAYGEKDSIVYIERECLRGTYPQMGTSLDAVENGWPHLRYTHLATVAVQTVKPEHSHCQLQFGPSPKGNDAIQMLLCDQEWIEGNPMVQGW